MTHSRYDYYRGFFKPLFIDHTAYIPLYSTPIWWRCWVTSVRSDSAPPPLFIDYTPYIPLSRILPTAKGSYKYIWWTISGADPGFQVMGGVHLKKLLWAEGGAKSVWVFRVKNHDFTPKNHIFSNLGGAPGARRVRPPSPLDPPLHISLFIMNCWIKIVNRWHDLRQHINYNPYMRNNRCWMRIVNNDMTYDRQHGKYKYNPHIKFWYINVTACNITGKCCFFILSL